ncbi:MAG: hypothetical protein N4A49_16965 [Marinifilaceae bacterium]|jgi:hypothetical protein|nr:hypothetical protein [Marinifilaceae bacterium]
MELSFDEDKQESDSTTLISIHAGAVICMPDIKFKDFRDLKTESQTGISIGVSALTKIKGVMVKPTLSFLDKRAKCSFNQDYPDDLSITDEKGEEVYIGKWELEYSLKSLELSILACVPIFETEKSLDEGFKIIGLAGPSTSYKFGESIDNTNPNKTIEFEDLTAGITAGILLKFKKVTLEACYTKSLKDISDNISEEYVSVKLGFAIFSNKKESDIVEFEF